MKKQLALLMAGATMASAFAGCAGAPSKAVSSGAESAASTEASATESVTLNWAVWDAASTAYYQPLIDAYEAKNPNVNVEMVDLGSADYTTVLATQLAGGADDLDVISIKDIPGYSNLVNLGMLEPMNDLLTTDPAEFGGTIEQITTADGNFYGVPYRSDFWVVFYNKDLFDAAGVEYPSNDMTFDEYCALAEKLTSGDGNNKVYGSHYHTWRSAVQLFGILDGEHTIVDGTYDFLKPYYEAVLAQQNAGVCQDYATLKTSTTHYSGVFFNESVAMMNMGSWFISGLIDKTKTGENQAENWGMVKYPHPDGVEAGTTLGTITSLGINSKSSQKEAAADFINFVCGAEGAEVIALTGTLPAVKTDAVLDAIASMEGFPTDDNSKEALRTVKTYLEMPLHEKSADIEVVLNQAHDNIMTENVSIDEGIAEMNENVQAILNG